MTEKWKHEYICKVGNIYTTTIAFKVKVGGKEYGHYEEYTPDNKYRMLRSLVYTKHSLITAFYEELEYYINMMEHNPTTENMDKVEELRVALKDKRKGN